MPISYPPTYTDANSEENRLWQGEVARAINELENTGIGSSTGNLQADEDNGVITDTDDNIVGYVHRYLYVRLASDNSGTEITDLSAYTGSSLFIGVYNSPSLLTFSQLPNNANFVYREFSWVANNTLSYILGFRNLRFVSAGSVPSNAIQITNTETVIDLEAGASIGAAGADSVDVRISIRQLPSNRSIAQASNDWVNGNIDPTDWNFDPDGMEFNDTTSMKALVAEVLTAGNLNSLADRRSYTYGWSRNGMDYSPVNSQSTALPFLVITAADLEGRSDQFLCNVIST